MRTHALVAAVVLLAVLASVAGAKEQALPEDELPDGDGKKILVAACTSCHDLDEVTKFRGYYDRKQWREVVVTMVEYGAPVEPPQIEVLTDYLTAQLGKRD